MPVWAGLLQATVPGENTKKGAGGGGIYPLKHEVVKTEELKKTAKENTKYPRVPITQSA